MRRVHRTALAASAMLLAIGAGDAGAAIKTTTLQVSAVVSAGCQVSSTDFGLLNYGTHSAIAQSVVSTALVSSLQLQCTPGVSLLMQIDAGQYGRALQRNGGTELIPYRLYSDAAMSNELVAGDNVPVSAGGDGRVSLPVYGKVVLPGDVPAGIYGDVLQVQLSW